MRKTNPSRDVGKAGNSSKAATGRAKTILGLTPSRASRLVVPRGTADHARKMEAARILGPAVASSPRDWWYESFNLRKPPKGVAQTVRGNIG